MALSAHTLSSKKATSARKKRVGRGNGSGTGTYSTRGLKGQRSRSGGKGGTQRRGFKANLQKIPKLRGFKSLEAKPELVTLATLERICESGDVVTPKFLANKGVVDLPQRGVKIVSRGELIKKINVKHCHASKSALEQIEKAGGTLVF